MNQTIEVLNNRYSVRKYQTKDIEEKVLNEILESGLKGASAGNLQPFSVIKIKNVENKKFLSNLGIQKFVEEAPVNLLFCLDFNRLNRWSSYHKAPFVMDKSLNHFWVGFQDVIILAQTIETAANSLGIGSCYIGTTLQYMDELQEHFKLPKGVIPIVLLPLGYIKQDKRIANKLDIDLVVHDEEYHNHDIEFINDKYRKKYGEPKLDLNADRIKQLLQVVEEVEGINKRKEVESYLKTQDKVSWPMRYFGLHYVANYMAKYNTEILDFLYRNGFIWAKGENHPSK